MTAPATGPAAAPARGAGAAGAIEATDAPAPGDRRRVASVPTGLRPARFYATFGAGSVGMAMTAPVTALYALALGASESAASLIVSVMVVSFLALDLVGSQVVPRVNARTALVVGYALFGVGSILSAVAPGLPLMVGARVLQGLAAALPMAAGFRMALRLAGAGREATEIARFNMCSFFGMTVGPLLVAAITGWHARTAGSGDAATLTGMRWAFAACGVVNMATAVLAWRGLPSIPSTERPRLGLPPRTLFAGRRLRLALVASGLGFALRTMFGMTLLPLLGRDVGAGVSGVAAGTTVMAVCELGGIGLSGRLGDRHGRRPVVLVATAATAAGLSVAIVGPGVAVYFALCAAMGVSLATLRVVPAAMIVDLADDDESASIGWRLSCDVSTLVTAVAMSFAIGAGGLRGGFVVTVAVTAGVAALTLVLGETRRHRAGVVA